MLKEVLVITDNPIMTSSFMEIVSELELKNSFSYAISPFSDKRDFENSNEIMVYNLKDMDVVDYIKNTYDIVFSIHCKQLFPEVLVSNVKCINVHPGFNPHNRGWFPQVFSILNNQILGATIHEIDSELDNGRIIARKEVELYDYDTSLTAYERVLEAEKELLRNNLERILNDVYQSFEPEFKGELKLKKDFNELLKIDLDKQSTVGETIRFLRAMSHGEYPNAYYISKTGEKVYISVNIRIG